MKLNCRNFYRALLALAALLEFSAAAQTIVFSNSAPVRRAIPRRSSVILIVAHGLGYGDLSCYGQQQFQTPDLDKLAADGVRFTNYFAEKSSVASQAALMFGETRNANTPALASDEITVAQILKRAGYHTGLLGNWNLGDKNSSGAPWKKGFDEFLGFLGAQGEADNYADHLWLHMPHLVRNSTNNVRADFTGQEEIYPNTLKPKGQYIPDLLTKAVVNFAKDNKPDPFNRYRPFFLLVNYTIPEGATGKVPSDAPYSGEPWPQAEKNRAAMISRLDGYIGQIREGLNNLDMTNNVAIFFTSDSVSKKSGGVDPKFFHSNISTNDFRVPMIICWPGNIAAGQVSGEKYSAKDFLLTAAEIGFARTPKNATGKSMLSKLRGVDR